MNEKQQIGHLNELRIATAASQRHFRVLALGRKYNDGVKSAATDLDVLISKDGKLFALEVKDYMNPISLTTLRADLDSLVEYKRRHSPDVFPVFTIVNQPENTDLLRIMRMEATSRDIELIFGNATEQMDKLTVLASIL